MFKIFSKNLRWALGFLIFSIVSCAVITVNIYFPEKDVKAAYQKLEEELMKPEKTEEKPIEDSPGRKEGKPESKRDTFNYYALSLVSVAYAQDGGQIAELIKKMPDVVQAYKEMGARAQDIDRLRNTGVVGEGNNGLLSIKGNVSKGDMDLIDAETRNRTTVIRGMAKAILRINRVPEKQENLNQVLPQAASSFASTRRDTARPGWWVQLPDGRWVKK
ncbi:MAG: DUF1318 domain-containing protein [Nitrospirae bacterium]|nr:DUF1318 domain-containing protein [Nitrospirota bacterium]